MSTNNTHLSMSKKTRGYILEVLSKKFTKVGEIVVNCKSDLNKLLIAKPDLVIIGMKDLALPDRADTKSYLSVFLNENKICSVGSSKQARIVSGSKSLAKKTVRGAGIPTAKFFIAQPKQFVSKRDLPLDFPLFVKPPNRGRGAGIDSRSVVRNFVEFQNKVEEIYNKYQSESLVEQYLPGREFSVAILKQPYDLAPLVMPIEIIAQPNSRGDRILGSAAKTEDNEQVIPVKDAKTHSALVEMATKIFHTLGARDYGRIDFRMDEQGQLYFLEANLSPGLGHGYFARASRLNYSLDYEAIILKLVELGLTRDARQHTYSLSVAIKNQGRDELHKPSLA